MRWLWSTCLLLTISLAGCSSDAPQATVVTIDEGSPDNAQNLTEVPSDGSVAGIVLDEALRPIKGVTVKVPGLERTTRSDEAGRFGLSNLPAGPLFLRFEHPKYHPAGVETVVERGGIAEVQGVLRARATEPYVALQAFRGFADLTTDPMTSGNMFTCDACTFQVNLEGSPEALVIEAGSERTSNDPSGSTDDMMFYWRVYDVVGDRVDSDWAPDPMRINLTQHASLLEDASFRFELYPQDFVPRANVEFDIVVAAFYNGADPEAWSVLGGSP